MWRSDRINLIAIVLSLLLHGLILFASAQIAIYQAKHYAGPAIAPVQIQPMQSRLMVDNPPTPRRADEPRIEPITIPAPSAPATPTLAMEAPPVRPVEKPLPIVPAELMPHDAPPPIQQPDGFGELTGTLDATALHSLSGDRPMRARQAETDQPYISRDPSGHSPLAAEPAKTAPGEKEKPGETKDAGEPVKPEPTPVPTPVATPDKPTAAPADPPKPLPKPTGAQAVDPLTLTPKPDSRFGPQQETTQPPVPPKPLEPTLIAMAQPPVSPQQEQQAPKQQPSDPQAAGREQGSANSGSPDAGTSANSKADPAPMTDSEMDPFSTNGSVDFRAGRVNARFGRKVKFVKPRLDLSGSYDLFSSGACVIFHIRADETGKVRDVKVVRSSGSRDIDQPCMLAVYEWWFEPPRDKDGRPQPAEMEWTITFHSY